MGFVATGDKHQAIEDLKAEMQKKMARNEILDDNGKIKSSILPSYIDDTVEGHFYNNKFYEDDNHSKEITGEQGKIYVDVDSNCQYRWSGSQFINITTSVISDTQASDDTTYSSNKINNLLSGKTEVKDDEISSSKTYSSQKINTTFQSKTITDAGGYFQAETIEGALQELGSSLNGLETLLASI